MRTTAIFAARGGGVPAVAPVLRDTLSVALIAAAVGAVVAAFVVVVDVREPVRDWYGLTPDNPARIGAGELWLDNARAVLLAFAGAAAVTWWRAGRRVIDVALVVVFSLNVLVVAVALGAYGGPLWRLGPAHYPLELVAAAIAGAAYLDARRRESLNTRVLVGCALAAALALLMAAVIESRASS